MSRKKTKKEKKQNTQPDFCDKLTSSKQHIICLGFLLVLPVFLFHASILGGQQYMGHDVIQWRAGAESLMQHQEQYDETAHWATNMFSGMPATTISHPPQISNLDNTVLSALRGVYPAGEMWILLFGAYFMLILLGSRPLSALFGAIVIGFTTYIPIIIGAGHNAKFLAYIYIPWLYIGYLMLTRSKFNPWTAFFVFALALTLHLRAYHPQVTYFFLFPLGTLFIYDLVQAIKENKSKSFAIQTAWLMGAAVISLLITIQLYWSTFEYSSFSMRGGSELAGTDGLSRDYAFAWSQGWGELLTLLIPGAYGGSELYWGPKTFTSGPHYAGVLAFLFFVIGVLKSTHQLKWVFLGPGIATLLFSLGEHFGALNNLMFAYFPLFDKFRVPEMWLMITVFCFTVPAVFGLDWMLEKLKQGMKLTEVKKSLYIPVGLGLLFIFIGFSALSFEKPGERQAIAQQIATQNQVDASDPRVAQTVDRYIQNELIPEREDLARGDTIRFAVILLLGVGIIWAMSAKKIPVSAGAMAFSVIIAFDLITVDQRYLSERSLVDGDMTREGYIERAERELDRYLIENTATNQGWNYRVLPLLDNAFNNAIPAYFYPSVGGYSGAKLGYYQDLIDEAIFSGSMGINLGVLNMLNVRYITNRSPVGIPGFETVYQGEDGVIIENTNVLPKAWFVNSIEVLETETEVLRTISNDFNPSETAFITQELSQPIRSDIESEVRVTNYSANSISIEITRSEPGFLVLGEIWYPPGWNATLNGEELDIIRTNYVLRGFEIPAGESTLELNLEPVWYETGNWLATSGTLLLFGSGGLALFISFRKREDIADSPPEHDDQ